MSPSARNALISYTGGTRNAYILRTLNSSDFDRECARQKLSKLDIEQLNRQSMHYATVADEEGDVLDELGGGSLQGQMLRLGASINTDSYLTVRNPAEATHASNRLLTNISQMGCAGAILSDLQRRRSLQFLPDDPEASCAFRVRKVEIFSLFNSMFINADTIVALQIMQPEFHPNSHQRGSGTGNGGAKESLSVFGLFHRHARTKQGRARLRQLFLRPSLDIDLIKGRQYAIAILSQPSHAENVKALSKSLGKIGNMTTCIALLHKGVDQQGHKVSVHNNV